MLGVEDSFLVLIDVQEKLAAAMHERESLIDNNTRLVKGIQVLGVPILWTEQNPKGLGPTVVQVRDLLVDITPLTKLSFSCCGEETFLSSLKDLRRKQAIVCGIECHVCVYQTVAGLISMGYEVQVVADAVSSRTFMNKEIGLSKCKELGASITSVETVLFELLKKAEGDWFRQMLRVVK
jgi:nicotinamidase-related amidase